LHIAPNFLNPIYLSAVLHGFAGVIVADRGMGRAGPAKSRARGSEIQFLLFLLLRGSARKIFVDGDGDSRRDTARFIPRRMTARRPAAPPPSRV
jgi:hypothetical protein